ncbi:MAG TPA: hypothetical protein VGJ01_03875 [Pseudolabrys sp.]|jgi:hypothetical protein
MNYPTLRLPPLLAIAALGLFLAGCTTTPSLTPEAPPPPVTPTLPPAFPPQDIVGRWGLAAYHREEDRGRTEAAAASQCRQPYIITLGPTGGVMMHLADQATPTELRLKGAPGGKTFIGPPDDPPGGAQDREVVQFDGRVLILRWLDPEVQGRYGTMVYVRCGAEGAKKPGAKPRPKTAAKPAAAKPKPADAPKPVQ